MNPRYEHTAAAIRVQSSPSMGAIDMREHVCPSAFLARDAYNLNEVTHGCVQHRLPQFFVVEIRASINPIHGSSFHIGCFEWTRLT